jgi:F-type H+-transporting ATPase subunit delta
VSSAAAGLAGLAERYAAALFDLADQSGALETVGDELGQIDEWVRRSDDLTRLIRSPVISRGDQQRAMNAILDRAGLSDLVRRFVGVVVRKRRLFALPDMIRAYRDLLARRKGETTAEVVSARPLTKTQTALLSARLKKVVGTDVALTARVDPDILGGLVVKVGSQMVDSSLRTKLNRLSLAIKGIG